MADQNINFTITTKAELAGAQAVVQSLERQIGHAKASGKAFDEQATKLEKAKAMVVQYVQATEAQAAADRAAAAAATEKGKAIDAANKIAAGGMAISNVSISGHSKAYSEQKAIENFGRGSSIGTSTASIAAVQAKAIADAKALENFRTSIEMKMSAVQMAEAAKVAAFKKTLEAKHAADRTIAIETESLKAASQIKAENKAADWGKFGAAANVAKTATAGIGASLGVVWSWMLRITYLLPGLGMAGLIGGIAALAMWLKDKLIPSAAGAAESLENLRDRVQTFKDKMSEARLENAKYYESLNAIGRRADGLSEKLEKLNARLESDKSGKLKILDREKDLALAVADQIPDEIQKRNAKLGIEKKYSKDKNAIELELINNKIFTSMTTMQSVQGVVEDVNKRRDPLMTEKANLEANIANATSNLDKNKEKLKRYQKDRDELLGTIPLRAKQAGVDRERWEYQNRDSKQVINAERFEKAVELEEKAIERTKTKLQALTTKIGELEAISKPALETFNRLSRELPEKLHEAAQYGKIEDTSMRLENQTMIIKNQGEINEIKAKEQKKIDDEAKKNAEDAAKFRRQMALKSLGSPEERIESAYGVSGIYSGAGSPAPQDFYKPSAELGGWTPARIAQAKARIAKDRGLIRDKQNFPENSAAVTASFNEAAFGGVDGGFGNVATALDKLTNTIGGRINANTNMLLQKINQMENKFKDRGSLPNERIN